MIAWTLLLWSCTVSGCRQEPPRAVYANLTAADCAFMRQSQFMSNGVFGAQWTESRCVSSNEKPKR